MPIAPSPVRGGTQAVGEALHAADDRRRTRFGKTDFRRGERGSRSPAG
jgi:hypothetical protein